LVELPAPSIRIPRRKYIVDYSDASEEDIHEALTAPPVERIQKSYSLEEIRRSHSLRERMRRVDLDDINFEFGSWEVTSDQLPKLERLGRVMTSILRRRPGEVFLIEGYTDAVGSDIDNLTLSDRRAEEVALILTEQFDVPPENLVTQGYGEQFLKVDTQEAERSNRRVAARRITPLLGRERSVEQR
jgi:outer membrane protein OmpA-like peptidoglycan-associated protein